MPAEIGAAGNCLTLADNLVDRMFITDRCICCRSGELTTYPAIVAPFLAARALRRPASRCRLLECRACGFRFFDVRLDDAEMALLYDGYRGEAYYRERHRHEWWYTRRTNRRLGDDASTLTARRAYLRRFLESNADTSTFDKVLDYGGDRGQVIPDGVARRRYVFDPSGVDTVAGVTRIGSEADLRDRTFDLILLSHVLEHASDPCALLRRLRELCTGPQSRVYVEVPYELPRLDGIVRGSLGERYLDALLRLPPVLRGVDFYSTLLRVGAGWVPPLGLVKAHEHLNFFTAQALRSLLEWAGFDVQFCGTVEYRREYDKGQVFSCLARISQ